MCPSMHMQAYNIKTPLILEMRLRYYIPLLIVRSILKVNSQCDTIPRIT